MHRLRFIRIVFWACLAKTLPAESLPAFKLRFRVTLLDVELTRQFPHVYFSWSGLGRWDYVIRTIGLRNVLKRGWIPLTYSEHVRYVRSLKTFAPVTVTTRVIAYDEKMFFFEHRYESRGELAALIYASGSMRGRKGFIRPIDCDPKLKNLQAAEPALIELWRKLDQEIKTKA